jgi:hypothetical protein
MMIDVRQGGERPAASIEDPVRLVDGGVTSAVVLLDRLYKSPYWDAMNGQQYRFPRFEASRNTMPDDFGVDVLPIEHQLLTWFHAERLLPDEATRWSLGISPGDFGVLKLALLMHDMGESTHEDVRAHMLATFGKEPPGDKSVGEKTDEDRFLEAEVRRFFYDTFFPDVSPLVIARAEAILWHKDRTMLHEVFEAAHIIQTFETAMKAGRKLGGLVMAAVGLDAMRTEHMAERIKQLTRLYVIVGSFNLRDRSAEKSEPSIYELAKIWPHAEDMLIEYLPEAEALDTGIITQLSKLTDGIFVG